jgi:hypothetical protein
MFRHIVLRVAIVFLSVQSTLTLQAQDAVLKVIPEGALAIAYVNQLERANEGFTKVSRLVGHDGRDLLQIARATSGLKQGVDNKGMLALAVLPGTDAAPVVVAFVPTSDYQALIKQFEPDDPNAKTVKVQLAERTVVIGQKEHFAVIAAAEHQGVLEAVLDSQTSIAGRVEPLREFLNAGDFCIVVPRSGVELAMREALKGLEIIKAQIAQAGEQAQIAAAGIGVYESLFNTIRENVTHFAMTARIDQSGTVHIASQTLLKSENGAAAPVKTDQATALKWLKCLPPGPFVFALGGTTEGIRAENMMKWSVEMWRSMGIAGELDAEQTKKLVEAGRRAMEGVRSMGFVLSVGEKDEPLYGRMYVTSHVDDAESYLERYEEMIAAMRSLTEDRSIPFYSEMEVNRIEIGDESALEVIMGFGSVPGAPNVEVNEIYKRMFGGDKMRFYMAAADKTTVVGAYTSQDQLIRALELARSEKADLSDDDQIAATAKLLPGDAQWTAYLSPQGSFDFAKRAMSLFAPEAPQPAWPQFAASPPFGFALKITSQGVETDLVAPADTLKAIGQFNSDIRRRRAENTQPD